jgi:hypothetical protein
MSNFIYSIAQGFINAGGMGFIVSGSMTAVGYLLGLYKSSVYIVSRRYFIISCLFLIIGYMVMSLN